MTILVTGATGLIGQPVADALLRRGEKIRVLSRDPLKAKQRFPAAEVKAGNVLRERDAFNAVWGCDTVIHLAGLVAYKDRAQVTAVNVQGTKNIADACKRADVDRAVFASSVAAMGPTAGPADEQSPCKPTTSYGRSKLAAETYVTGLNLPAFQLRIAPVYGPGAVWWARILDLLNRHPVVPVTQNRSQILHTAEAADAILRCLDKKRFPLGAEGTVIIAGKEALPIPEVARILIARLGKRPQRVPAWLQQLYSRLRGGEGFLTENREYDLRKAQRVLGYQPWMDFRDHAQELVDWWQGTRRI